MEIFSFIKDIIWKCKAKRFLKKQHRLYINKESANIIANVVKDFIRYCINSNSDEILYKHGVTSDRIKILKGENNIGYKTVFNEVFRQIMSNIGYYEAIEYGSGMDKVLTQEHVNSVLINPSGCKISPMSNYYKIYGVKQTLDYVAEFDKVQDCNLQLPNIGENLKFEKGDRCYHVNLEIPEKSDRYASIRSELSDHDIVIGTNKYHVSNDGLNVGWQLSFTKPTKVDVYFNKFYSANLKETEQYYLRYITEIPSDEKLYKGEVGSRQIRIDGYNNISSFHYNVNDCDVCLFQCSYSGHNYIILDANKKMTIDDMLKLSFASFVALGMLERTIYLNECLIVASDTIDFENPLGLFFSRLSPSVKCEQIIFTQNVFSVLTPIGKKIFDGDKHGRDGVERAGHLIHRLNLGRVINPITEDIFGNIVSNFLKYESLERGIYIILSMSSASLEMMGPSYAVALEAITNVSKDILPKGKTSQIDKDKWEKKVKPALDKVLDDFAQEGLITCDERDNLQKKIRSANQAFNTDKLDSLLKYYNYPLSEEDKQALKDRNSFLHGSLDVKNKKADKISISDLSDNVFSTSLIFHKLCCSTVLLMSGFKGYIVNNNLLYGLTNKGTGFIKIPKEKLFRKR